MRGRIVVSLLLLAALGCGTAKRGETPPSVRAVAQRAPDAPASKVKLVILRIHVDNDGAVREVQVVRSAGARLDAAAVKTASRARFVPPREDGQPIESTITMPYRVTITR
jgi:TonB family protein